MFEKNPQNDEIISWIFKLKNFEFQTPFVCALPFISTFVTKGPLIGRSFCCVSSVSRSQSGGDSLPADRLDGAGHVPLGWRSCRPQARPRPLPLHSNLHTNGPAALASSLFVFDEILWRRKSMNWEMRKREIFGIGMMPGAFELKTAGLISSEFNCVTYHSIALQMFSRKSFEWKFIRSKGWSQTL